MIHGLLWLPLLVFFIWITRAGWNEYQKVETYKQWAAQFERAKYDIYAALGQTDSTLTWGRPTRQGIVDMTTLSLEQVDSIELLLSPAKRLRSKAEAAIELQLMDGETQQIPFTDQELAQRWQTFLAGALAKTADVGGDRPQD